MDVDDEGRTWRKDVISSARLSQVCFNLSYLSAGLAEVPDVPFPSNASPDQMGHIVPPAGSGSAQGSPTSWTCSSKGRHAGDDA